MPFHLSSQSMALLRRELYPYGRGLLLLCSGFCLCFLSHSSSDSAFQTIAWCCLFYSHLHSLLLSGIYTGFLEVSYQATKLSGNSATHWLNVSPQQPLKVLFLRFSLTSQSHGLLPLSTLPIACLSLWLHPLSLSLSPGLNFFISIYISIIVLTHSNSHEIFHKLPRTG